MGLRYLAELLDPSFEYFYLDLVDIERIVLDPWKPIDLPQEHFVDLDKIFQGDLEILAADIEGDQVRITCIQSDSSLNYTGGNLYIRCRDILIYDHLNRAVAVEELEKISKQYWDDFATR